MPEYPLLLLVLFCVSWLGPAEALPFAGALRVCCGPECCISQLAALYGLCSMCRDGAVVEKLMLGMLLGRGGQSQGL